MKDIKKRGTKDVPMMAIPQGLGQTIVDILQKIEHAPGVNMGTVFQVCATLQEYSILAEEDAAQSSTTTQAIEDARRAAAGKNTGKNGVSDATA